MKKLSKEAQDAIKDIVLSEAKKGNIVVSGYEGLQTGSLSGIVKQPVEGILYDINRGEEVILTFIDDPKWVNDYACAQVIRELKKQLDKANEHLEMEMNLLLNEALIGNRIKRLDVHSNGIAQYIIDFMERRGLK